MRSNKRITQDAKENLRSFYKRKGIKRANAYMRIKMQVAGQHGWGGPAGLFVWELAKGDPTKAEELMN